MIKRQFRKFSLFFLVFLMALPMLPSTVNASTSYYVSVSGNDSNTGTQNDPWKTIQKAVNTAIAGDTIYVRGGTYNEKIVINNSGNQSGYITLQNYSGETPIINGSGLTVPPGYSSMVLIENKSYVKIIGLEIYNYKTTTQNNLIMGIYISGSSNNIEIKNCKIHEIQNNSPVASRGTMGTRDAHGIAIYGTNAITPISNIIIDNCELYDCILGSSETLVVNGNVDGWQISNNNIHNNDNIGIDVIGWEGKCPTSSLDQARNGVISGNLVHDICTESVLISGTTRYNPCYGVDDHSSDLIYVDGGKDTIIERNICYNGDFGMEIASEHANKTTNGITVRNNLMYNNHQSGLSIGGNENDSDGTHGFTTNSLFYNNTLYKNDTLNYYSGELCLKKAYGNQIRNNIIYGRDVVDNSLLLNAYMSSSYTYNNVLNNNIWYSALGSSAEIFQWRSSSTQKKWSNYKTSSSQDANSLFTNPLFINESNFDFHLQASSPAINIGAGTVTQYGANDLDGSTRVLGTAVDAGAYEYQSGSI